MNCENCTSSMSFVYDVIERETCFVLWECECGHKTLERRPQSKAAAARANKLSKTAKLLVAKLS